MGGFFSYRGRLSRSPYFWWSFAIFVTSVFLAVIVGFIGAIGSFQAATVESASTIETITSVLVLGIILGMRVLQSFPEVRRLHDLDRPSAHYWLQYVPLFNIYLFVLMLFQPGAVGQNQYARDPLTATAPTWSVARRRLRWSLPLAIVIIVAVAFSLLMFQQLNRGSDTIWEVELELDLAGDIELIYQVGSEDFPPPPEQMEGLIATITRRVNRMGVAGASIRQLGADRLVIQLRGVADVQEAKALIGRTAVLQIMERICADGFTSRQCSDSVPGSFEDRETGLDGSNMNSASAGEDPTTGRPVLVFRLRRDAAADFAILTQRLFTTRTTEPSHPDQLAFVLDGELLVSATMRSPIFAGNGQITGDFTIKDIRRLVIQLESGRLPFNITELSSSVTE